MHLSSSIPRNKNQWLSTDYLTRPIKQMDGSKEISSGHEEKMSLEDDHFPLDNKS